MSCDLKKKEERMGWKRKKKDLWFEKERRMNCDLKKKKEWFEKQKKKEWFEKQNRYHCMWFQIIIIIEVSDLDIIFFFFKTRSISKNYIELFDWCPMELHWCPWTLRPLVADCRVAQPQCPNQKFGKLRRVCKLPCTLTDHSQLLGSWSESTKLGLWTATLVRSETNQ